MHGQCPFGQLAPYIEGKGDRRHGDHGARIARRRGGVRVDGACGISAVIFLGWGGVVGLVHSCVLNKIMGIRYHTHIVSVMRLCITLGGCRHISVVTCVCCGRLGNRVYSRTRNTGPLCNFALDVECSFTRLSLCGKKGLCARRGSKGRNKRQAMLTGTGPLVSHQASGHF